MKYVAAVVQLTATHDAERSLDAALGWVRHAAEAGAQLVALPEALNFMGPERDKKRIAEDLDGPTFRRFSETARDLRIHLLAGSIPERVPDDTRLYNTSTLWGPNGARLATYRKIHLFDADVGDGRSYRESDGTRPGERGVVAETELGRIGLSVCYDLRFPSMYRSMAKLGADVVAAPSAFTVPTGTLHWEPLLRARAIENQCYVLAPAQEGTHGAKRVTYGHSMIVGPSGEVLACRPRGEGLAWAELDLDERARWADRLPTARHEPDAPIPVELRTAPES